MLRMLLLISSIFFIVISYAQEQNSSPKLIVNYQVNGNPQSYELPLNNQGAIKVTDKHFTIQSSDLLAERYQLSLKTKENITLQNIRLELPHQATFKLPEAPLANYQYFCNGFQSWTTSQELSVNDKIRTLASILKPYGQHLGDYNHYYRYPKKKGILHSWSFTYKRLNEEYAFIGSLNEDTGYTLFVHDAKQEKTSIIKDCQGLTLAANTTFNTFDLVFKKGDQQAVWEAYTNALGSNPSKAEPAIGWTSWYNYYDKIDEKIILDNLNNFSNENIPLDIFQIDDGYQSEMGDWLTSNSKFPNGMAPIAQAIHDKGYKAGLWLAPFVAGKKSKTFQEHPEWFVKDKNGKPLKVAINVIWGGPYYAFDIYQPAVQEHLKKVIQTILFDWKYDMIKVDFLFAVCLKGTAQKTRGQIMSDAMKLLREYAGDKLILGCGVPLAPSFHQVDYCRVGNDAHLGWEFGILKGLGNAERPSTWSTLTNTIMRYPLSQHLFLNDPDVFILRTENTQLNAEEKYTMLLLNNLLGAVVFNSDNIANYDSIQMQQYKSIFPYAKAENVVTQKIGQGYEIKFNIQDRDYLLLCNMGNKTMGFQVPSQLFFNPKSKNLLNFSGLDYSNLAVDAHASKLLYQVKNQTAIELLGGDNHLITGQEVNKFKLLSPTQVEFTFKTKAQQTQTVYFYVKDKNTKSININGKACPVHQQIASYIP